MSELKPNQEQKIAVSHWQTTDIKKSLTPSKLSELKKLCTNSNIILMFGDLKNPISETTA